MAQHTNYQVSRVLHLGTEMTYKRGPRLIVGLVEANDIVQGRIGRQARYDLGEVTRDGGRLQLCVADELESYASSHPDVEVTVRAAAQRAWAEIC